MEFVFPSMIYDVFITLKDSVEPFPKTLCFLSKVVAARFLIATDILGG
jgi:hypothetical protein